MAKVRRARRENEPSTCVRHLDPVAGRLPDVKEKRLLHREAFPRGVDEAEVEGRACHGEAQPFRRKTLCFELGLEAHDFGFLQFLPERIVAERQAKRLTVVSAGSIIVASFVIGGSAMEVGPGTPFRIFTLILNN